MIEREVVIVGGGPTGLMMAGELALAGIDVAIVERRANQRLAGSRAGGLHARTLEVLDQRGIVQRFVSEGTKHPAGGFNLTPLDFSDLPSRHNYVLGLWQNHIERILARWVDELGVTIHRNTDVTGFAQSATGLDVSLADGRSLRAQYLVGCDGGRSMVRKTAGIGFPGCDPSRSWLIAEFEIVDEPKWGFHVDAIGRHGIGKVEGDGPVRARAVLTERGPRDTAERTPEDLSELLVAVYGTDFGVRTPMWISSFSDMARQAASYRSGRVLLAGDAAHIHPPMGGQGLNIGVQDAVNLGWKLAQVINGTSPDTLLDSYHAERHPVAARVLQNTMAQSALARTDEQTRALGGILSELLGMNEPRRSMAAELSGLGVRYDLGGGHPLLGRRMPDLDIVTADGATRVFALMREARAVLLNLGEPDALDVAPWAGRLRRVDASCSGAWELPVIGSVAPPAAVLIRPDGYVAWVGDGTDAGLFEALTKWCGAAGGPAEQAVSH